MGAIRLDSLAVSVGPTFRFGNNRRNVNKLTSLIMLSLVGITAFFTIFGNHGLLRLIHVDRELETVRQQNSDLESEIMQLKNKMFGLEHSSTVLEKTAREELGLSKPDEIVYIFSNTERSRSSK